MGQPVQTVEVQLGFFKRQWHKRALCAGPSANLRPLKNSICEKVFFLASNGLGLGWITALDNPVTSYLMPFGSGSGEGHSVITHPNTVE